MTDTDIITVPAKSEVPALFSTEGGIEGLVATIEKQARSLHHDYETDAGRKQAKSQAAKVARSKTLIDEVGKGLNEERLAANKLVNEQRNMAKTRLDALRDEIKAPALEFEAKEAERVRLHMLALDQFATESLTAQNTAAELQAKVDLIKGIEVGDAWEEFEADAKAAKAAALMKYDGDLAVAKGREAQEAELEALRADKAKMEAAEAERAAAQAEKERQEQIEQAKAMAEQRAKDAAAAEAKVEAERKERELDEYVDELIGAIKGIGFGMIGGEPQPYAILEHDLTNRIPLEIERVGESRWPRVEAARIAALECIEAIKAKQIKDREDEKQIEAAAAAQAERDRIVAEKQAEVEASEKRAANKKHIQKIKAEIVTAITNRKPANWEELVDAMLVGEIPHVKVLV